MTITVNTKVYTLDSTPNASTCRYRGPKQSFSEIDNIEVKRQLPKKTAEYNGNARAGQRITRSAVDAQGKILTAYVNIDTSIPVGFPPADATALRVDAAALFNGSVGADVVDKLIINF